MARSGLRVGAALVGLWLGSAPAEASTRVPGTTWRLSDSSDWTAQEVDALAEAAVGLPEALRRAGWNRSRAARRLGIDRTTLWRKIREYGLEPEE